MTFLLKNIQDAGLAGLAGVAGEKKFSDNKGIYPLYFCLFVLE